MRKLALILVVGLPASCTDLPEAVTGPGAHAPAAAPVASSSGSVRQLPPFQPGVVVVRFRPGADGAALAAAHGARVERDASLGFRILRVPEGRERSVVEALSANPAVELAELSVPRMLGLPCAAADGDCTVPSDEFFGRRWDLHNDGVIRDSQGTVLETVGPVADADMDWLEAYDYLGQFSGGAVVGVVDSGILGGHEDLAGRLVAQHDFFNIDDVAEDNLGHGTHVAGIALGLAGNGVGAAGVAYGPNVKLMVAKGCDYFPFLGAFCWSPDIADGIVWLVDQGVDVINLSLGASEDSGYEQAALQYAQANDVLPVCAAGNDGGAVHYPGALPECMAVSATEWSDTRASYSSAGPEVEVSAPGGDTLRADALDMIVSTWVTGEYAYLAGTSMAAPQVTGLAALVHALGVTSAADKRALLKATADDLGQPGPDPVYGEGRINVWSAVQAALSGEPPPPPPDNQPPTSSFTGSCTDLACDFTDASTDGDGSVVAWSWDFGDAYGSTAQNPSHTYGAAGTYTVGLTVTDDDGATDVSEQEVTVSEPANQSPTSSFTWSCTDLACDFTDASTDGDGSVVAWSWDFGDAYTSSAQDPSHAYAAGGTYTVVLTVTDDDGATGTSQQELTVSGSPPPPEGLQLAAEGFKEKGQHVVRLVWGGATTTQVDLYRDGGLIATVSNSLPTYDDHPGGRGKATYVYQVCEAGATTVCSEEATVVF